ncbi:MAG: hypothetical protein APG12_01057 [Candidatus Methanofastidiosum methylothiophilum]|uniref:DUF998 domain-containing protein n=1 Tax=Candidatus Methanofastidiosum methylothiophilum TaxID=1705564 RepID=A0A150IZH2_9EURY|nr:MAG: hypothetical protein APG10_00600 [Candidatus Methanofastidiosum methylthiophilus]KYC47911.1 MAG: hypothetical protein APG11_00790 [Candidatus Methanofastidiosum methylthiophilus]KYC50064.1 MAG: hypothetical protein APG12_01057 [Candidatus Methanofastidiosum methylthiophilus]
MEDKAKAGLIFMCGAIIFLFGIMLAEFTYDRYSVSQNMISDLGANQDLSAAIFNSSILIFGISAVYSANIFRRTFKDNIFSLVIFLAGTGAIIVGIFNVNSILIIHYFGALMSFILGAISILYSTKIIYRSTLSYLWIIMGSVSLVSIAFLFICWPLNNNCFGVGYGSVERLIVYPIIVWAIATGSYLISNKN